MYCSSCGGSVARGLSYCNHCGAKLGGAKTEDGTKQSETFHESLVWAIVVAFVGGVGVTIGLMAVMKEVVGFTTDVILAVTLLSFLLILVVESVLIWLLVRQQIGVKKINDNERTGERATQEINPAAAPLLAEPATSVTEHTTRIFEPIYSERESK